jgi:hypothetical protein
MSVDTDFLTPKLRFGKKDVRKMMSLERQVRIVGLLRQSALDRFIRPRRDAPVFAGITDSYGMGMLIARMPWNKRCRTRTLLDKMKLTKTHLDKIFDLILRNPRILWAASVPERL